MFDERKNKTNHMNQVQGIKKQMSKRSSAHLFSYGDDSNGLSQLPLIAPGLLGIKEENNLNHAIDKRQRKNCKSDFTLVLDKLNDRIDVYRSLFLEQKPIYLQKIEQSKRYKQELKDREMQRAFRAQQEEQKRRELERDAMIKIKVINTQSFYDQLSTPSQRKTRSIHKQDLSSLISNSKEYIGTPIKNESTGFSQFLDPKTIHKSSRQISQISESMLNEKITPPLQAIQTHQNNDIKRKNDEQPEKIIIKSGSLPQLKSLKILYTKPHSTIANYVSSRMKKLEKLEGREQLAPNCYKILSNQICALKFKKAGININEKIHKCNHEKQRFLYKTLSEK